MRFSMLCAAAAALMASAAAAQTAPPPVEAFGALPMIDDASISPDGTKVAMALTVNGVPGVTVFDLARRQRIFGAGVEAGTQLRSVAWADDQRVTALLSQTFRPGDVLPPWVRFMGAPRRVDYFRNAVFNLTTQRWKMLSTDQDDAWSDFGATLLAPIEGDPGYARLIGAGSGGASGAYRVAVYRVELDRGFVQRTLAAGTNEDTVGVLLDERGAPAARLDSDQRTNRWRLFAYDAGRPRQLVEEVNETGFPVDLEGVLPDGRLVVREKGENSDLYVLYALDRTTGEAQVLFERPGVEISGVIRDPWTHNVVGARWTETEDQQHFFDPLLSAAYAQANTLFAGGSARLTSWSRDRSRAVVYGERGLDGGGYYVLTPAENALVPLAMRYPLLQNTAQGERRAITYRARDGQRIPAYLTLPPNTEARSLPAILLVHGGPHHVRDDMNFDWWASFLASRGYAVIQPNYRGSGGYGANWENAGRRQWGGLMQTDVEDGVAALGRAGIIDPARVCIVGASYGGYAALAGATLTPDRYKCAASIAGVSDLGEMLRQVAAESSASSMSSDFWRQSIGDRHEDSDQIRAVSPAQLADRVRIPILLIHGTDDTVVPIDQSRRMLNALNREDKNVRFVELRGDDHWLSDAPTRIQMLRDWRPFSRSTCRRRRIESADPCVRCVTETKQRFACANERRAQAALA